MSDDKDWIVTIETAGGRLVDIVGCESRIKDVTSPHYVMSKDVEPLGLRLKELGYEQVQGKLVPQLIQEGFIKVNKNPIKEEW